MVRDRPRLACGDSLSDGIEGSLMLDRLEALGLRPLSLKGRRLLPIVQGGMGVGVSAHRLSSAVAREDAVGTIASVDLRHHHSDLMSLCKDVRDRAVLDRLNLI